MTDKWTIKNVYCAYVDNQPYLYTSEDVDIIRGQDVAKRDIVTGWQVLPNMMWSHLCTPKQWAEFVINNEAYHVDGVDITLFSPIPITTTLAIQRTNQFAAFNNCTYMWGYTDDIYETSWHNWLSGEYHEHLNLAFKEGAFYQGDMNPQQGTQPDYTWSRYKFPTYVWKRNNQRTGFDNVWGQGKASSGVYDTFAGEADENAPIPAGVYWDPLCRPDSLQELRAGKNSMKFSWKCHDCDAGKFYNLDQLIMWSPWTTAGPYCAGARPQQFIKYQQVDPDEAMTRGKAATTQHLPIPGTNFVPFQDYTIPDFSHVPIVPNVWWWHEMKGSIIDREFNGMWRKADKYWCGTEQEQYKYPPMQHFVKGIPLFDATNALIRTATQVSVLTELHLTVKKRRSAYFCPTWGPFSGQQLYYHNRRHQIYQPGVIRYRTGGMRRTWQNECRYYEDKSSTTAGTQSRNRENQLTQRMDPYSTMGRVVADNSVPPARSIEDSVTEHENRPSIEITISQTAPTTYKLKPRPRTITTRTEPKDSDIEMLEHTSMTKM